MVLVKHCDICQGCPATQLRITVGRNMDPAGDDIEILDLCDLHYQGGLRWILAEQTYSEQRRLFSYLMSLKQNHHLVQSVDPYGPRLGHSEKVK